MALFDEIRDLFPWLTELGISPAWLQETAAESASSAEVLARIRETEGYKRRFPGLKRTDGSLRMTEAQYMATEKSYRQNLRYFGYDVDRDFSTPDSLKDWFSGEVDPNEQRTRLEVLDNVKKSSQLQRDTYYVYTGKQLSIDDLYGAKFDEAKAHQLYNEYRAATTVPIDYQTFIDRATQVALNRATEQGNYGLDPEYARSLMDQIHHGSAADATRLPLGEMLQAFEFATIGAAAVNAGLGLPTKERLAEIRSAGVERQAAIQAYSQFGQNKDRFNAAAQRALGREFSTRDFEQSQFFQDATQSRALAQSVGYMEAAGKQQGAFRFSEDPSGRFVQSGLTNR